MKKIFTILLLLVSVHLGSANAYADSTSDAYQKYANAYKSYQQAIAEKQSDAKVQAALKAFQIARQAYVGTLPSAEISKSANSSSTNNSVNKVSTSSSPNLKVAVSRPYLKKEFIASFTPEVSALIQTLRETESKEEAIKIIAQLEKLQSKLGRSDLGTALKYETAVALERLAIDSKKSVTIFAAIAKYSTNKRASHLAKLRLNLVRATGMKKASHKALTKKFQEMTDAFNSYSKGSWFAFPIKAVRGVKYLSKSVSFVNAQNKEADLLLYYEAAAAPFVPPVSVTFDEFQKESAPRDENLNATVRLLYNNYDAWYARWNLISNARSSIDMQYFIIENDAFGLSLLGLLLKKAQEGVKIRLMVDGRGSNKLSMKIMSKGYLQELAKESNIEVKVYNPIQTNLIGMMTDVRRIISSNHDKIIVIDGRYSVVGGRNIADEYLVDPIDDETAWRDCDVIIDSEYVNSRLMNAFEEEFSILKAFEVGKSLFGLTKYRSDQLKVAYNLMDAALHLESIDALAESSKDSKSTYEKLSIELKKYKNMNQYSSFDPFEYGYECPVKILDKHSLSGPRNEITETIVKMIDGCETEILIQNPYVVLTPRAEAALKRAGKRNIPILVHTNSPQTSDSFPTEAMLMKDWRTLLTDIPSMKIFARVNEGQLHAKNFVFDRQIGIVGTYNFDYLSEKVNSEVVAVIKSEGFSKELREGIQFDISKAVEYHLASEGRAEFGPEQIESKKMWLIKILSKMGWLRPLF